MLRIGQDKGPQRRARAQWLKNRPAPGFEQMGQKRAALGACVEGAGRSARDWEVGGQKEPQRGKSEGTETETQTEINSSQRHAGHRARERRKRTETQGDSEMERDTHPETGGKQTAWGKLDRLDAGALRYQAGKVSWKQPRPRALAGRARGSCLQPCGPQAWAPELHDTAFGLVCVRVFEPQSLFRSVFLQVGELPAVDGSSPLPRRRDGVRSDRTWPQPPALAQEVQGPSPGDLEQVLVVSRAHPMSTPSHC